MTLNNRRQFLTIGLFGLTPAVGLAQQTLPKTYHDRLPVRIPAPAPQLHVPAPAPHMAPGASSTTKHPTFTSDPTDQADPAEVIQLRLQLQQTSTAYQKALQTTEAQRRDMLALVENQVTNLYSLLKLMLSPAELLIVNQALATAPNRVLLLRDKLEQQIRLRIPSSQQNPQGTPPAPPAN